MTGITSIFVSCSNVMVTFEVKDTELLEQLLLPHSMIPTISEPTLVLQEQKGSF